MLTKVQGYVTWGEAEPATVELLLKERGETVEGRKLGSEGDGTKTPVPDLARAVSEKGFPATRELRPLFRLRAPKGGWRSTKKPFALGGALGYRGRAVNDLVRKMI